MTASTHRLYLPRPVGHLADSALVGLRTVRVLAFHREGHGVQDTSIFQAEVQELRRLKNHVANGKIKHVLGDVLLHGNDPLQVSNPEHRQTQTPDFELGAVHLDHCDYLTGLVKDMRRRS